MIDYRASFDIESTCAASGCVVGDPGVGHRAVTLPPERTVVAAGAIVDDQAVLNGGVDQVRTTGVAALARGVIGDDFIVVQAAHNGTAAFAVIASHSIDAATVGHLVGVVGVEIGH